MKPILLLLVCSVILLNAFSQTTGDYQSKASGNWNVASNWERYNGTAWVTATMPPSSSDGIITVGHTITNTTPVTVDQLVVGGTLIQNSTMTINNGPGDDITIAGIAEFHGTGMTIPAGATFVINGNEIKLFSTITNNGTINWNSGYFSFDGGTLINNNNFNAVSNFSLHRYSGGGTFTNGSTGIFTRLTSEEIFTNNINFTNNGTMNFQAGTFYNFYSFTNAGTMNFSGGTFENAADAFLNAGSVVTGTGTMKQSNDSLRINLALTLPSTTAFIFNTGVVSGTGSLKVAGSMQWFTGTLNIPSTIQNGATLDMNGNEAIISSTLTNNGTINWNTGYISFDGGTLINNKNFNALSDLPLYRNSGGGTFTNSSTGVFTRLTGTATLTNQINFTNNGTMNFQSGIFYNFSNFTNTGTMNFSGGTFENAADAFLNTGSVFTGTGTLKQLSDTMRVNLLLTFPAGIAITFNGGAINGAGSIKLNGNMSWITGRLVIPATILHSGILAINGGEVIVFSTLTNNGTINWNSGYFSFNAGKLINNEMLNITGDNEMYNYGSGSCTNGINGVVSKTSTGVTTVSVPFTNNGKIKGLGSFAFGANLTNKGSFAPGLSPGILTTGTDYTNKILEIEMQDGSGPGTGHDKLLVNGNAQLKDTLKIFRTGIVPVGNYTILSCTGTLTGKFKSIIAPEGFTVNRSGNTVVVNVPKPGVSVNDASIGEGNAGNKQMRFVVALAYPSNLTTKVDYQTVDSTATVANNDYAAKNGTLTFAPGQLTDTISITIKGDALPEPDELFYVQLLNPAKLIIKKEKGIGTIINNDGAFIAGNGRATDEIKTANALIIPNLLHRNEPWEITGLNGINNIITLADAKGMVVYKLNNYQNSADLSKLIPGSYFYQIMFHEKNGQTKSYTGKLVITE